MKSKDLNCNKKEEKQESKEIKQIKTKSNNISDDLTEEEKLILFKRLNILK